MEMRRRPGTDGEEAEADSSSFADGIKRALPKMDMYPKIEQEYNTQTDKGGVISLLAFVLMGILFLAELTTYMNPELKESIRVDQSLGDRLRVNVNMTFHSLTCAEVEVISMDVLGEHQMGVKTTTHKHRLNKDGSTIGDKFLAPNSTELAAAALPPDYCGACYGADAPANAAKAGCCNTCDELKDGYTAKGWSMTDLYATAEQCVRENKDPAKDAMKGEGCNLEGFMDVNKVNGNFHMALGKSKSVDGRLIHEFNPEDAEFFNTSHTVHSLGFGPQVPGMANPLDGHVGVYDLHKSATGVFQYFIKIVPTIYIDGRGRTTKSNQFSFTHKFTPVGEGSDAKKALEHEGHHGHGHRHPQMISALPGVFFVYELSPFVMHKEVEDVGFFHFFTRACSVVGGAFTISGIVSSLMHVKAGK